jgi:predicted transcriptional regulator of viral defense system
MNNRTREKIKIVFYKNNGYARTKDIVKANIHKKYLKDLLDEGSIYKLKRGLYRWNELEFDYSNEIIDVTKIVPDGVICLTSALSYYDLTTYTPLEYQIAIYRKSKIVLPEYPPIRLYYFSNNYYQNGINELNIDGNLLRIYDVEKTICDCFRYSNEIAKDILLEGIKEYMKREDKNINKLMKYAQNTSAEDLITKYVEALL